MYLYKCHLCLWFENAMKVMMMKIYGAGLQYVFKITCICIIIKKALWGGGYDRQIIPAGLN